MPTSAELPSTASLVRAAEARNIPWLRLNSYSLVQFGQGRYQQRIQATTTGRTSNIAVELASDKEETNGILRNLGLPVPRQELVRSRQDAVRAAERIGYPLIVKPSGQGSSVGMSKVFESDELAAAVSHAFDFGSEVLVERCIVGDDVEMISHSVRIALPW